MKQTSDYILAFPKGKKNSVNKVAKKQQCIMTSRCSERESWIKISLMISGPVGRKTGQFILKSLQLNFSPNLKTVYFIIAITAHILILHLFCHVILGDNLVFYSRTMFEDPTQSQLMERFKIKYRCTLIGTWHIGTSSFC